MENFLTSLRSKYLILFVIIGLIFVGVGVLIVKTGLNFSGSKVEVLNAETNSESQKIVTVEISGEVIKPGVYKLPDSARIDDLLIAAGGLTGDADRIWTDKYLNRAAKINDGQKVFIPSVDQQSNPSSANKTLGDQSVSSTFSSDSNRLININSASLSQLDSLPGIGQVYGQSIIEHRPYSTVEELLSKGALKKSIYDKVKDLVSVY